MSARELITEHLDLWAGAVTKKSSSGRGSNGKIELNGVKKLRELIVELALSGRLVEPEPGEEPAHRLLSRIEAEKSQLAAQGLIKKPKKLPEASDSQPYSLPPHWCWARLGSVTNYGTTDKAEPNQVAENTWVLELEDIEKESSKLRSKVRYMERQFKSSKNRFERGDVLYGKLRPYLDKVLVADESGVCTTEIIPIRSYFGLLPEFLRLALKSPSFKRYANDSTHGMNLPRLGTDKARLAMIPLAPEQEQHRIVQKIDELMALCDRLEQQTSGQLEAHETLVDTLLGPLTQPENTTELADNWARLAAHFDTLFTTEQSIDKLKQTILQLAVMGRLVEQDAGDEPAENMLDQLAEVKQELITQGLLKKERKSQPGDSENAPYEIPESWSWCSLTDIGELARGKSKHRPRNDPSLYQDGTVPLIQTGDVARASPWITTFSAKYNQRGVEQSRLWRPGTLCITIAANIGDTGLLSFDACFPDSVVGFTPFWSDIPPEYFEYFLRTAKQHLEDFAPSTAQKNINLEVLQKLLVPLPPLPEVKRIVQKVDELMALCDQLKERLNQASKTRCQLTEAVVEGALNE